MKYGICNLGIIACRKEPSDKSEMVTQLLFGEHYRILDTDKTRSWALIKTGLDDYECWIDISMTHNIPVELYKRIDSMHLVCSADTVGALVNKADLSKTLITIGSTLPFFHKKTCTIENTVYKFKGKTTAANSINEKNALTRFALMFLNVPYLWGGRSPFGIDCSGFIQMLFKLSGCKYPRDAWQQAKIGQTIDFIEESKEGDLAFFENNKAQISHAGLILKNGKIIHASGKVRIDMLDHNGIYNNEISGYTHKLKLMKRISA